MPDEPILAKPWIQAPPPPYQGFNHIDLLHLGAGETNSLWITLRATVTSQYGTHGDPSTHLENCLSITLAMLILERNIARVQVEQIIDVWIIQGSIT